MPELRFATSADLRPARRPRASTEQRWECCLRIVACDGAPADDALAHRRWLSVRSCMVARVRPTVAAVRCSVREGSARKARETESALPQVLRIERHVENRPILPARIVEVPPLVFVDCKTFGLHQCA